MPIAAPPHLTFAGKHNTNTRNCGDCVGRTGPYKYRVENLKSTSNREAPRSWSVIRPNRAQRPRLRLLFKCSLCVCVIDNSRIHSRAQNITRTMKAKLLALLEIFWSCERAISDRKHFIAGEFININWVVRICGHKLQYLRSNARSPLGAQRINGEYTHKKSTHFLLFSLYDWTQHDGN